MKIGKYKFGWQYRGLWIKQHEREVTQTTCSLYEEGKDEALMSAAARNHHSDQDSKDSGRKASLSKLLNMLKVSHPEIFHRKFRAEIWEAYRTMTKVPRWKIKEKKQRVSPQATASTTQTQEKSPA